MSAYQKAFGGLNINLFQHINKFSGLLIEEIVDSDNECNCCYGECFTDFNERILMFFNGKMMISELRRQQKKRDIKIEKETEIYLKNNDVDYDILFNFMYQRRIPHFFENIKGCDWRERVRCFYKNNDYVSIINESGCITAMCPDDDRYNDLSLISSEDYEIDRGY